MGKKSRRKSPKVQEVAKPVAFTASGKPLLDPNVFGPVPDPDQVKAFWGWFETNEDELFRIFSETKDYVAFSEPIEEAFERVFGSDRMIVFECTWSVDNACEHILLTLTPDGSRDRFNLVLSLCDASPSFHRWNVLPFRPRDERMNKIAIAPGGVPMTFDTESVRYLLTNVGRERNGLLNLVLFTDKYYPGNEEACQRAIFPLLDHVLGEYEVVVHIYGMDITSPEDERFNLSSPLTSLAKDFDLRLSRKFGKKPKDGWIALRNTDAIQARHADKA